MELVLIWILITSTTTEVIEALNQMCLEVLLFNGDLTASEASEAD